MRRYCAIPLSRTNTSMHINPSSVLIYAWYLSALVSARTYECSLQSIVGLILELGTAQITLKTSDSPKEPPLLVSRYPIAEVAISGRFGCFFVFKSIQHPAGVKQVVCLRRLLHVALSHQSRVDEDFTSMLWSRFCANRSVGHLRPWFLAPECWRRCCFVSTTTALGCSAVKLTLRATSYCHWTFETSLASQRFPSVRTFLSPLTPTCSPHPPPLVPVLVLVLPWDVALHSAVDCTILFRCRCCFAPSSREASSSPLTPDLPWDRTLVRSVGDFVCSSMVRLLAVVLNMTAALFFRTRRVGNNVQGVVSDGLE